MLVRETDKVEDTTQGSDSYSAGWRYYTELEFDLGANRIVVAEVENDGRSTQEVVTIRGVFEGETRTPAGEFYDAPEAANVIASLQQRGLTRIRIWNGAYFSQFDAARLKDAP
ncbi:MAG: hypothetical protein AB7P07_02050 [Hyphomonadaceae bacterium]